LSILLEKDPAQRFQTPNELLKAMPTITAAIDARRRIPRVGTRKPPARLAPKKISIARLPVTGSDLFGREEDIAFLNRAWANKDVNVVTFYAINSLRGRFFRLWQLYVEAGMQTIQQLYDFRLRRIPHP
jgi:hypothetical protein